MSGRLVENLAPPSTISAAGAPALTRLGRLLPAGRVGRGMERSPVRRARGVVEYQLPPRALGAPLHTHHREDEYCCVLTGRAGVQLGEECSRPGRGS